MTKAHFIVMFLGLSLFFWDFSYGTGWLLGWIFIGLLQVYRGKILDYVIDFNDFSTGRYILYLIGVMVWIAIPLLLATLFIDYINPLAVFGAYFIHRAIMFISNSVRKGD